MHISHTSIFRQHLYSLTAFFIVCTLTIVGLANWPASAAGPTLDVRLTPTATTYASGDTVQYRLEWSCAATVDNCENSIVSVTLPRVQLANGTTSTDSYPTRLYASTAGNAATPISPAVIYPTAANDGSVTYALGTVAAGTSAQAIISFTIPAGITPGLSTITPVATYSASGNSVTATSPVTITSSPDLNLTLNGPTSTPPLGSVVTYRMNIAYPNAAGGATPNGHTNVDNATLSVPLPACATYSSSYLNNGRQQGTYDPATHSISWNLGTLSASQPDTNVTLNLLYPRGTCTDAPVTLTAQLNGTEHEVNTPVTRSASATHSLDGTALYDIRFNKWNFQTFERGSQGNWILEYGNSSSVPVTLEYTDYIPCSLTSPTDGSTDCATPAIKVRQLWAVSSSPITLEYWTNTGTHTTATLPPGGTLDTSAFADDEWITKIHYTQDVLAGESGNINVVGIVNPDIPTTEAGVTYHSGNENSGEWTAGTSPSWVRVQNCVSDLMFTDPNTGFQFTAPDSDLCNMTRVYNAKPSYYNAIYTPSTASAGDTITINAVGNNTQNAQAAAAQPMLSILLPCGVTYVEGSASSANPGGATISVDATRMITDNGCERQLVAVTWPGQNILGQAAVNLRATVSASAPAGARDVDLYVSPVGSQYQFPNSFTCVYSTPLSDIRDVNINGLTTDEVCRNSASVTISELAAVNILLEGKGSLPSSQFVMNPDVSVIRQGERGTYRITPTNIGNAPLSSMTVYGTLPHVGDTDVQGRGSRDSGWTPVLTGPLTFGDAQGISPSNVTIEYSTSTNPCRGEVITAGAPMTSAPSGCTNDWTATPSHWADVKAYRVYINGHTTAIAPGASIQMLIHYQAPNNAQGIAYESVAIAATQARDGAAILPVEPIKVATAVALDVAISKTITNGATVVRPGDQVVYRIDVGNVGQGLAPNMRVSDQLPRGLTVTNVESHLCSTGFTSGLPPECSTGPAAGSWDTPSGIWTVGHLAAGEHASLYLTTTVTRELEGGTVTNEAHFATVLPYDLNQDNDTSSVSVGVLHHLDGRVYLEATSAPWDDLGISGRQVDLVDANGNVVATTTTDTMGAYQFDDISNGTYRVVVRDWDERSTLKQVEAPGVVMGLSSDPLELSATHSITQSLDFGFTRIYSISGSVFFDSNRNSTIDGVDEGLGAVTLDLLDDTTGQVVSTTTTNSDGRYTFFDIPSGIYRVRINPSAPILSDLTLLNVGTTSQPYVMVDDHTEQNHVDFPYAATYTVSGSVSYDPNKNGVKDAGENGIGGVTIRLIPTDGSGYVRATTTLSDGSFQFASLPVGGTFYVQVDENSENLRILGETYGPNTSLDNNSSTFTLDFTNRSVSGLDFGYGPDFQIRGSVYRDTNQDGLNDPTTDYPLVVPDGGSPVRVELLDASGNVVRTVETGDGNGYVFSHLAEGTYSVRVVSSTIPQGLHLTGGPEGRMDGTSPTYTLTQAHPVVQNVDFGYLPNNVISGFVYRDNHEDVHKDSDDPGVSGVQVILWLMDTDTQVATTMTDQWGAYSFEHLNDGSYEVRVPRAGVLAPWKPTEQFANSYVDPDTYVNNDGSTGFYDGGPASYTDVNFGFLPDYSVAGTLFRDGDRSATFEAAEPTYAGVSVSLVDESGTTVAQTVSDASGAYSFTGVKGGTYRVVPSPTPTLVDMDRTTPGDEAMNGARSVTFLDGPVHVTDVDFGYIENQSISGTLYVDADRSSVREAGENGLGGATVNLVDANGSVVATTTTNADGTYSFDHLADGTYRAQIDEAEAENLGYLPFTHPAGGSATSSAPLTLDAATHSVSDVDFGLVFNHTISGRVFRDVNRSASFDSGEAGFDAVSVQLVDASDSVVATTVTDEAGAYSFSRLLPGTYRVRILPGSSLAGAEATLVALAGSNDTSGAITLDAMNVRATDVDFGYAFPDEIVPSPAAPTVAPSTVPAPSRNLARTGASSGTVFFSAVLALAGMVLVGARRRKADSSVQR